MDAPNAHHGVDDLFGVGGHRLESRR
jgi:hypothetical protein